MSTHMNESDFNKARELARENEPVAKKVRLSEIEFSAEGIKNEFITLHTDGVKKDVPVTQGFIRDLAKVLNVNPKLAKEVREGGFYHALLDALKTNRSSRQDNPELTIVGNAKSRAITGLYKNYGRLSNDKLFDIAMDLVNKHSHLYVHNAFGGGNPTIVMKTDQETAFPRFGPDETFNFGIGLRNVGGGTDIGDFNFRLVCSNGLMSPDPRLPWDDVRGGGGRGGFHLGDGSTSTILDFFNLIDRYSSTGFVPYDFENRLARADKTFASLAELETAQSIINRKVDVADGDAELRTLHEGTLRKKWLWGIDETVARLEKKNVKVCDLTTKQKQFIRTPQPMWDLVNSLTNLGSNTHVEPLRHKEDLIMTGGRLFNKKRFDLENADLLIL